MILTSHNKERVLWFAGVIVTVGGILAIAHPWPELQNRDPASVPPISEFKAQKLNFREGLSFDQFKKSSGEIEVTIRVKDKPRLEPGAVLELEASVHALSAVENVEFAWLLPDGITAESGELKGPLGSLQRDDSRTIRLLVKSSTSDNRQIHLHVFRNVDGEARGHIAQYNTVDQEKIEAVLSQKAERLGQKIDEGYEFKLVQ